MKTDLILAIETSGRTGSVALGRDGALIGERTFSGLMRHSAELFPSVSELLGQADADAADLSHVYITAGPGSFTGLRIAVTAAKMFNLALNTPIVALDSLDVIAQNATDYMEQSGKTIDDITVVLDAKKDYFFAAAYNRTPAGWNKYFGTAMITAQEITDALKEKGDVFMLGEGLVYHKARFEAPDIKFLDAQWWPPHARNLLRLGQLHAKSNSFADPLKLVPVYIRKPDAVEKMKRS